MALLKHPDRNKDKDTTIEFRELAKALEVLSDENQRELYDYYLDHPKVSSDVHSPLTLRRSTTRSQDDFIIVNYQNLMFELLY